MVSNSSTDKRGNTTKLNNGFSLALDCIKDVSIIYDKIKKQYSIKIPKEVVDIFNIQKGDRFRFKIYIRENEEIRNLFEIVKDGKISNEKK